LHAENRAGLGQDKRCNTTQLKATDTLGFDNGFNVGIAKEKKRGETIETPLVKFEALKQRIVERLWSPS